MGEAVYYFKATFAGDDAAVALPRFQAQLEKLCKAYDFWQANRHKPEAEFWSKFEDKFPGLRDWLSKYAFGGASFDCNNDLAGKLSYGDKNTKVADCVRDKLASDGLFSELRYVQEVWHFAEWEALADWCERELGALKADYLSDEYLSDDDYFKLL